MDPLLQQETSDCRETIRKLAAFGFVFLRAGLAIGFVGDCFQCPIPLIHGQTLFQKPHLCRSDELFVQLRQHRQVIVAAHFEKFSFLKSFHVFAIEKRCRALNNLCGRKYSLDRIVIVCWHGIEFVIVAPCALERMGQKRLADTVHHVVQESLTSDLGNLHASQLPRPHA